jgi:hypothetical protein
MTRAPCDPEEQTLPPLSCLRKRNPCPFVSLLAVENLHFFQNGQNFAQSDFGLWRFSRPAFGMMDSHAGFEDTYRPKI